MFRFVEHTGEVELELHAASPAAVLEEAVRAFAELAGGGDGAYAVRRFRVEASTLPDLLPLVVDELVFLLDTEGFVPRDATVELERLVAHVEVRGVVSHAPPLVKAATLHRLAFAPGDGGWQGRLVLDV